MALRGGHSDKNIANRPRTQIGLNQVVAYNSEGWGPFICSLDRIKPPVHMNRVIEFLFGFVPINVVDMQLSIVEQQSISHRLDLYCSKFLIVTRTLISALSCRPSHRYTANVCRDLQGLYREIGVLGFQIYGDCMLPVIPVISHFRYTSKYCMEKMMYALHPYFLVSYFTNKPIQ